ncbi:IclR family transcriptional regulator [Paenibacillus thalictri]|uniref:IclR family transcriptional regulator n=1 Tax=Paenibacillus thalictri TaxID=2527873 RepID=A0A4Q9DKN2_9BACL|nr:IclR family transcriptional regulator [Paenibacillus thalictri]TBL73280.1 IclR family transcriptional regulator [Paenibacillus thalictri]
MEKLDPSLKALEIIEACGQAGPEGLGVTEIVNLTGLSRSTVHRLVASLVDSLYLRRVGTSKKFKLGYRLLRLTDSLTGDLKIKDVASPYLHRLSEMTQEAVHLIQMDGNYAVYVDKIDSPQPVGLLSKVGTRLMLHCTGAGKVLLADLSPERRERIFQDVGLPAQTPNTITDINQLNHELEVIKIQGYSMDRMENRDGIYCIAGPIYNHRKEVVAAFSVSGPSFRFSLDQLDDHIDDVKETTRLISEQLGCLG